MNLKSTLLIFLVFGLLQSPAHAQARFLKKVQERAEDEAVDAIFGKKKDNSDAAVQPVNSQGASGDYSGSNSGSQSGNNRGGGLTNTPPDVPANINDAGSAFGSGNYQQAKYNVRQAILGVEMEIGQNILDELPESVQGLPRVQEEDRVSSMSVGFVGLTIERVYRQGDKQLKVTIGNDAAMLSAVNMYMTAGYASSTDQGYKQVTFKGNQGILEYDDYSGYKLSVPFGQSSIFVAGGVNFSSEEEIMSAAEEFDLEKIKTELGEQ